MIRNLTKHTVLFESHTEAKKPWDRILGLLIKPHGSSLVIKTRFGIHTFGMKNPIDILILDKENKAARLKENLSPWRIFIWNPKFDTVIELPSGSIKKSNTKLGDLLSF